MRLEFHQLDRRWEHLRAQHPARQRRLLASLAEVGQQTPIVVVAMEGQAQRYVVIDGYKRITALRQLGRDTVEAVEWPMGEAEAVLLERTLRLTESETALELGWLLAELEQRFGYSLEELARRFDRSVSWVSRRLALVESLPEAVQQQVREGKLSAQVAMKYLVPAARICLEDCQRMAAIFAAQHCDTRAAGRLYAAWRDSPPAIRQRILDDPALFLKTQRQADPPAGDASAALLRDLEMAAAIVSRAARRLAGAAATELNPAQGAVARQQIERMEKQLRRLAGNLPQEQEPHVESSPTGHHSGTEPAGRQETGDRTASGCLSRSRAQSPGFEIHRGASHSEGRESRALPVPHPGAFQRVQGEPGASP
jgi:ParB/RepB/Spo0J family partition protein